MLPPIWVYLLLFCTIYHFGTDLALFIYIFQYLALFTYIYPYLPLFGYIYP